MAGHRIGYLATLGAVVLFHCFYSGWASFFALVGVLLLPLVSLAFSLPGMGRLMVRLTLPGRLTREEEGEAALTCDPCPFPAGRVRGRLVVKAPGCPPVRRRFSLPAQGGEGLSFDLRAPHCGSLTCTLEKVRVYDLAGLFSRSVSPPAPPPVLVHPVPRAPSPVPRLPLAPPPALTPKPGGGFSEEHDLRLYRPGDPMRSVHWKLSAKVDDLVVREPLEMPMQRNLLSCCLVDLTPEAKDRVLDELVWMSRRLLSSRCPHYLHWRGEQGQGWALVRSAEDLEAALAALLRGSPSLTSSQVPATFLWHYAVAPKQEEVGAP